MGFMQEELERYSGLLAQFPNIAENMDFMQEGQESSWMSNSETDDMCDEKSHSASNALEPVTNNDHDVLPEEMHTSKASNSYRLMRLKSENENLKTLMICKRCNSAQVQTLTLPCCHIVCCESCADAVDDCPLCNARILGTVRIFMC